MAKNRELSQVGSLVTVNDSSGAVGIANSVGINTTAPTGSYALDVHGTINSNTDVQIMESQLQQLHLETQPHSQLH